jgi:hypothetical protein
MSKATKLNFETLENPYNGNLDRGIGESDVITNSSGLFGAVQAPESIDEVDKEVSGQDLTDLWIRSWIKSRNYKPKTSGFLLDGKTGKIECTGLDAWGGTITGAIFQTGTSGERIVISVDNITAFDSNDNLRLATNDGLWMFWDVNGVSRGGIYGHTTALAILAENDIYINANSGASDIIFEGDIRPDNDATYDLGTRPLKWDMIYLDKRIRFDYVTDATISQINDSDVSYTRITFGANGGDISFHRNVDMLSTYKFINHINPTDDYDVATKKYVDDNVPAAGANTALSNLASVAINTALLPAASYSLGSAGNKWNNLYMTGSVVVGGTVDGVDVSTFATNYNTHIGSANSHHAQSHSHGSHTGIGANDHHSQSHSHGSHSGIGASDHHSSTSNGIVIYPSGVITTGYIRPSALGASQQVGTSTRYFNYMYSNYYKYKNAPSSWDAYDDLQILRDLKTSGKKVDMSAMPKEMFDKNGFTTMNDSVGFVLCASKKIVECIDDLKKTIDNLTIRLNKLEKI